MSNDPVTWNAGDFHRWVRPANPPCPDCECCTDALCREAIAMNSPCQMVGGPGDFDLSRCPCPTRDSAARRRLAASQ